MADDPSQPTNGTTGQRIPFDIATWMTISAFFAVTWYNVAQLTVSIFMTFKKRRGLYFWSLLVSAYGCVFHSLGFLLKLFALSNMYIACTVITIGWWPMVTGQSLVLYSRLHLVVKEQRILRGVLIMIIFNAITQHIPTTVFTFGSSSPAWQTFVNGFNVMEKLQMTVFCLQEFIISGIYMWATVRLLKPVYRRRTRSVMQQLIWINVLIVVMDITLLALEYKSLYYLEASLKGMVYSIKLTLEFSVLNQLMRLANSNNAYSVSVREDDESYKKSRRRPFRYLTKILPRSAPFQDEKTSEVTSPGTKVPQGTPASGAHNSSLPSNDRGNSLSYITTSDTTSPNGDRNRRPSNRRPSLAVDTSLTRPRQGSDASTIYNNPAAFVNQKRPSRDPYTLDGLSPIVSTPATILPDGISNFPGLKDRNTFGQPRPKIPPINTSKAQKASASPDVSPTTAANPAAVQLRPRSPKPPGSPGSRTSRFSALLGFRSHAHSDTKDADEEEDENYNPNRISKQISPPDPQLLKSHRPSVSDWAGYRGEFSDASSRTSSEARLDPTDHIKRSTRVLEANMKDGTERRRERKAAATGPGGNNNNNNTSEHVEYADGEASEGEFALVDDEILSSPEDDDGFGERGWARERARELENMSGRRATAMADDSAVASAAAAVATLETTPRRQVAWEMGGRWESGYEAWEDPRKGGGRGGDDEKKGLGTGRAI